MARKSGIEIEIDKLTNSIVNVISGDILQTEFHKVNKKEIRKKDWLFNWHRELKNDKVNVYKMTIKDNLLIIQGLLSFIVGDGFIFVNLAESAKFNRGKGKIYEGVGGNMFAFACKKSMDMGFGGYVSFIAKTALIAYYRKTLGAEPTSGQRMYIGKESAEKLVKQYFKK